MLLQRAVLVKYCGFRIMGKTTNSYICIALILLSKCNVIHSYDDRGHPKPLNSPVMSSTACILTGVSKNISKKRNISENSELSSMT